MTYNTSLPVNHMSNLIVSLFSVDNAIALFSYRGTERTMFLDQLLESVDLFSCYSSRKELYEGLGNMIG